MKSKFSGRAIWQNNKPFICLLLCLLLMHSVLKIIFYQYNHSLLFTGAEKNITASQKLQMVKWSLFEDALTILGVNGFFLLILTLIDFTAQKISDRIHIVMAWLVIPFFIIVNGFALALNMADVFYFRFHFQRANADLLYVLDHPWNRLMQQHFLVIVLFFLLIAGIIILMYRMHIKFFRFFIRGNNCRLIAAFLFICLLSALFLKHSVSRWLVPTYPMVELQSRALPFVQNSLHTLLYSSFRKGKGNLPERYMSEAKADSIMNISKKLNISATGFPKKNIVLFIMESVPFDFFDTSGRYKVNMPFFDSILQKSTFFNNAFCYAHESNKGITSILSGIPTLSDVPLYHSPYVNMLFTPVGTALKKQGYRSMFCIGDEFDNFGFAKCMNWLGIDEYYSMEDIPGYKKLPAHSMGLQDEAVLGFFNSKINQQQQPFLAIHYNISTHFPYDIPENFAKSLPAAYTPAMKAMQYYDNSLQHFFYKAQYESWFANTCFIFCSDHWLFPQGKPGYAYKAVSSNRIPIIIFDPANAQKKIDGRLASQFDIQATILAMSGYNESIISYGNALTDSNASINYVFAKSGSSVYQVIDSNYVLGFNTISNKAEYLYDYKKDFSLTRNLAGDENAMQIQNILLLQVKAFLQKTVSIYNGNVVKK